MASSNPPPIRHDQQINPRYTVQCGDSFVTIRRAGPVDAACDVCPWLRPPSWTTVDKSHTTVHGVFEGKPQNVFVTKLDP